MNPVDIAIVVMLVLSAVFGYRTGLIRAICSLVGLIVGISVASWYYKHLADEQYPLLHNRELSEAIWFGLIALLVMVVAGLIGLLIRKLVHGIGLGWLDKMAGLVFGILRGALLVTLCIVMLAAFFPTTRWLSDARLAKYFLGMTNLTIQITPDELQKKISGGLHVLEKDSPEWLHRNIP